MVRSVTSWPSKYCPCHGADILFVPNQKIKYLKTQKVIWGIRWIETFARHVLADSSRETKLAKILIDSYKRFGNKKMGSCYKIPLRFSQWWPKLVMPNLWLTYSFPWPFVITGNRQRYQNMIIILSISFNVFDCFYRSTMQWSTWKKTRKEFRTAVLLCYNKCV